MGTVSQFGNLRVRRSLTAAAVVKTVTAETNAMSYAVMISRQCALKTQLAGTTKTVLVAPPSGGSIRVSLLLNSPRDRDPRDGANPIPRVPFVVRTERARYRISPCVASFVGVGASRTLMPAGSTPAAVS